MQRLLVRFFCFVFVLGFLIPLVTSADVYSLQGWGWSSNIGWIKFSNDGNNWNVVIDRDDQNFFKGYAWSNHIGWVKFDGRLSGPSNCPADCHGVQLHDNGDGGDHGEGVTGWARACSVAVDCNFNNLKPNSERGGWDGWLWFSNDYGGGGQGGGDGFWWFDGVGDDDWWWWGIFECNDNEENDEYSDGIDEADPQCHTDGDPNNPNSYMWWWSEGGWGSSSGKSPAAPALAGLGHYLGWFKNFITPVFADHGAGHRIAGFGWGTDVLGWLFVDLEVDGDEEIPPVILTVTKSGSGTGRVNSQPPGIDCGNDCLQSYDPDLNIVVELNAVPASDSTFEGWSGDADCLDGEVTMDANKTCTATFEQNLEPATLTVTKLGEGTGIVTSSPEGINCGGDCSERYDGDTVVDLMATPDPDSRFAGWSGDPDCSDGLVLMDNDKTCTATFELGEPGDDPCETNGLQIMGDGVIEITSQPLDREVLSSFERIQNTCSEKIDVAVKDIISMVYDRGQDGNGSLIDIHQLRDTDQNDGQELIGSGNQKLPECLLRINNEEPRDCRSWDGTNFPLGPDEIATFGIEIWRPIRTIKDNQPYQVRLGDRCLEGGPDCNPDAVGRNVRLRFEYRVGNVIDE